MRQDSRALTQASNHVEDSALSPMRETESKQAKTNQCALTANRIEEEKESECAPRRRKSDVSDPVAKEKADKKKFMQEHTTSEQSSYMKTRMNDLVDDLCNSSKGKPGLSALTGNDGTVSRLNSDVSGYSLEKSAKFATSIGPVNDESGDITDSKNADGRKTHEDGNAVRQFKSGCASPELDKKSAKKSTTKSTN